MTVTSIILVEDNPEDVFLVDQALRNLQIEYALTLYEDGEEALRALASELQDAPDLILVDLNLPRRDGFEVLTAIRQTPHLVGIPVGVLTSSTARKDRHRAALIGVEQYISKPANPEEFVSEVGAAVQQLLTPRARGAG